MKIIKFSEGDTLEMKKPHPCGNKMFFVEKGGSDVRLRCTRCGRELAVSREKIERSVKKAIRKTDSVTGGDTNAGGDTNE